MDHAAGAIWDLRHEIGAPENLSALAFPAADIDVTADLVVRGRPVNPRPVDHACARAVLAAAYDGDRPAAFLP